jgi:transketolase
MNEFLQSPYNGPLYADTTPSVEHGLSELARRVRVDIVRLAYWTRTHHIGPALSCVDLLVALHFGFLTTQTKVDRDYFILSKGHAALALYVVLAYRGLLSPPQLRVYCNDGSYLGQHPASNSSLGIEVTSGSLGHGLSIGAGCALASSRMQSKSRTVVLMGDGELNEGAIWEAAAFAGHHKLRNLIAVIDNNSCQCLGPTTSILDMEPLEEKLRAFRWEVATVDGHDLEALLEVLRCSRFRKERPLAIIARTVKGCGISFMENACEWHHRRMSEDEYNRALEKLDEHEN